MGETKGPEAHKLKESISVKIWLAAISRTTTSSSLFLCVCERDRQTDRQTDGQTETETQTESRERGLQYISTSMTRIIIFLQT